MWPPDEDLLAAWQRLTADPTAASGAFVELVLAPLVADLSRRFPKTHLDDVTTAVEDAIIAFLRRPLAFDPELSSLAGYLGLIAKRRLLNSLAREKKHQTNRIPWDNVELGVADWNDEEETLSFADHPELLEVIAAFPEADRRVFDLILAGEKRTGEFAAVLGIADRPPGEQADEVKRVKDRIKTRLKRAGGNP